MQTPGKEAKSRQYGRFGVLTARGPRVGHPGI